MADDWKPQVTQLYEYKRAIFCSCASCGGFAWVIPEEDPYPTEGLVAVLCTSCGTPLSFYIDQVPEYYSPQAESCSPDGSTVAVWLRQEGNHSIIGRTVRPKGLRKNISGGSVPVEDKMTKLRKLQEWEARQREELRGNDEMLEDLVRLVDRERRKIIGTAEE